MIKPNRPISISVLVICAVVVAVSFIYPSLTPLRQFFLLLMIAMGALWMIVPLTLRGASQALSRFRFMAGVFWIGAGVVGFTAAMILKPAILSDARGWAIPVFLTIFGCFEIVLSKLKLK